MKMEKVNTQPFNQMQYDRTADRNQSLARMEAYFNGVKKKTEKSRNLREKAGTGRR